jgi:CubicO group peptidase (beta-lactamase class C family)
LNLDQYAGWLYARAQQGEFSGVAMAWEDGAPIFHHAEGLASRRFGVRNDVDTRFHVASITKVVTSMTALQLVEEGLLSLHDPLIHVLGEDERPRALTSDHTLHHLLSHTSGLPNYHDDDDNTPASFASAWVKAPLQTVRGPRDVLPLFADLDPVFAPGTDFRYADANYILTGILIEVVTGRAYADVATERVLKPAGMTDSSFESLDEDPSRLATGYMVDDGPADRRVANVYSIPAGGLPDGDLITTAADLCRLVDAILDGRLVEQGTLALAMAEYGRINDDAESYGYGLEMLQVAGRATIIGHAGGDPGISGMLSHYLDDGVTTAVLCNQDRGSWPAAKQLAEALDIRDPRV